MKFSIRLARLTRHFLAAVGVSWIVLSQLTAHPVAADPTATKDLDERKLEVAKHLTNWMQNELLAKKAIVAVVSRKGGKDVKDRDVTGMAHSGLAVYDPRAQTWILYHVMNVPHNGTPSAELWRAAPLDFFYGQSGYEEDALVLVPDDETQQRVYQSVLSGDAQKLLFTSKYNLLSKYDSPDSLNCNKWILMMIAAARTQDYEPYHVLSTIHNGFEPAKLRFGFIAREVVKRKSNVQRSELPDSGPVQTVTPESLYRSGLFKDRVFTSYKIIR